MIKKIVEFSTPGTKLSVSMKQLVVERPGQAKKTLPIEDLGVVIIDDTRATYTQSVFLSLMDADACVLITDRTHLPTGLMIPLVGHYKQTEHYRAQIETPLPIFKRIWQDLVRAKINQQVTVLETYTGEHGGLKPMVKRVRSGDPENIEAQAAQRYWPRLFGKDFRRDRRAQGVNALLNYGYIVFRSSLARAIVAAGLICSFGVHHKHRNNPFCLADDLLEPYRPIIDWRVKNLVERVGTSVPELSSQQTRAVILSLLNESVLIDNRLEPLLLSMHTCATSLRKTIVNREHQLLVPVGMPVERGLFE